MAELIGEGCWPPYIALVNPYRQLAYAMRFLDTRKLTFEKTIDASKDDALLNEPIATHITECSVCDAAYLRAFSVRLQDGVPEDYARRLWEAHLSFVVDGVRLVNRRPLREFLGIREFVIPPCPNLLEPENEILFYACALDDAQGTPKALPDKWLGYMCPNQTVICVELKDVPKGGKFSLIVNWELGIYTTKSA